MNRTQRVRKALWEIRLKEQARLKSYWGLVVKMKICVLFWEQRKVIKRILNWGMCSHFDKRGEQSGSVVPIWDFFSLLSNIVLKFWAIIKTKIQTKRYNKKRRDYRFVYIMLYSSRSTEVLWKLQFQKRKIQRGRFKTIQVSFLFAPGVSKLYL